MFTPQEGKMTQAAMQYHRTDPRPLRVPATPRAKVLAFVVAFYDQARADPLLGPVFERVVAHEGWPQHFETMTDFWMAVAFDGPVYRGNPLIKHALIRDITGAHFARWLNIFTEVTNRFWGGETAALLNFRAGQIAPALLTGVARAREKGLVHEEELH
jgi:hemoglobin